VVVFLCPLSSYTQQPDAPTFSDNGSTGCSASATITANQGFGPYQWFLDGNAIPEAKSNTYTTTITVVTLFLQLYLVVLQYNLHQFP
jgi:hypothetical protein